MDYISSLFIIGLILVGKQNKYRWVQYVITLLILGVANYLIIYC